MIILRSFLIARCQPPILLEAVDQPLNPIALPIQPSIKPSSMPLRAFAWDRYADPMLTQIPPDLAAAVALVSDDAPGPQPRSSASWSLHRALLHQTLKRRCFMALARCQHDGHRLARSLGPEMHF